MNYIESVFFDFDGVLIDSKPTMKIAWKSVQEKFNITVGFAEFEKYIGLPFDKILMNLRINQDKWNEVNNHYFSKTSQHKNLIKLNPYAHEIIHWLQKKNIFTGIVTSKDQIRTIELVENFNIKVDILVTPELTPRGKPFSDPIIFATNSLDTQKEKSLFIGDMKSDMLCAKHSNCKYLHYCDGYGDSNFISYGGSIYSLYEIKEYLICF